MRSLPERKRELVEELVERSRTLLPDDTDWTSVEPFVRQCYDDVGLDDLRRLGLDGLGHVARSLLRRIRCRPPGELSVHIYNPSDDGSSWASERTVIEVVTDDMPFLVDSLTGQLARRELTLHLAVHPQIAVRRDDKGNLTELLPRGTTDGEGVIQESVMHYQIDQLASQAERVELETMLRRVLADVAAAVREWHPMRDACRRTIGRLRRRPPEGIADFWEVLEFLEWVGDDHFTFLGTMEYDLVEEDGDEYLRPDATTALGLLRGVPLPERAHARQPIPDGIKDFLRSDRLLEISKTERMSTVHRSVHMDMISVKRFGDDGEVDGEIPLPRPVHLDGLQHRGTQHPDGASQGRPGDRPDGLPAQEPQRQDDAAHRGELPSGRAVPDFRGRPLPLRDAHPGAPIAPAPRAPGAPRRRGSLRHLHGLRAGAIGTIRRSASRSANCSKKLSSAR